MKLENGNARLLTQEQIPETQNTGQRRLSRLITSDAKIDKVTFAEILWDSCPHKHERLLVSSWVFLSACALMLVINVLTSHKHKQRHKTTNTFVFVTLKPREGITCTYNNYYACVVCENHNQGISSSKYEQALDQKTRRNKSVRNS